MNTANFTKVAYIASPLRGDIEGNMIKAADFCHFAAENGYIPYAPHLLFPQFLNDNIQEERFAAMQMSEEMQKRCDELWVFCENTEPSEGMRSEIENAKKANTCIRFFNMPENADPNCYCPTHFCSYDTTNYSSWNSAKRIIHNAGLYRNFPNFKYVLDTYGQQGTVKMMQNIEDLRFLIFIISYNLNGYKNICESDEIYCSGLIHKYASLMAEWEFDGITNMYEIVNELRGIVLNTLSKQQIQINGKNLSFDFNSENIIADIRSNISWDMISNMFFAELKNPGIINSILYKLFGKEPDEPCFCIAAYDFNNRWIEFDSKEQRDLFIERGYLNTGIAYSPDTETNELQEDYTF